MTKQHIIDRDAKVKLEFRQSIFPGLLMYTHSYYNSLVLSCVRNKKRLNIS